MPKQKTRKSITKRFKITKTGKVLHRVSFRRHLNEKKSAKRKRQARRLVATNKTYAKKIRKLLGK
ncbi:50S ribosomal protein L35 [Candidatus Woesebacteria bacterium GWB1_43_5]|uniref:Large ribosomal subunit protein bL35 n=1 Tax=Candidatus Woesebacteria bacterium GWB1_43_5 TaxID=1802474 RepID=A0A1F7WS18_9BACT|nr:MAG: 50S ribosomal protein L35 [Candidatus Woesebacteria bacterium GWB1_43_5]